MSSPQIYRVCCSRNDKDVKEIKDHQLVCELICLYLAGCSKIYNTTLIPSFSKDIIVRILVKEKFIDKDQMDNILSYDGLIDAFHKIQLVKHSTSNISVPSFDFAEPFETKMNDLNALRHFFQESQEVRDILFARLQAYKLVRCNSGCSCANEIKSCQRAWDKVQSKQYKHPETKLARYSESSGCVSAGIVIDNNNDNDIERPHILTTGMDMLSLNTLLQPTLISSNEQAAINSVTLHNQLRRSSGNSY